MKLWVGNPEAWTLAAIPWQFFCSLTFKGHWLANASLKAEVIRVTMWFALWRRFCRQFGIPDSCLLWCLRQEAGEVGGRMHLHALIGGANERLVNPLTCRWLKMAWRDLGGGHPDARVFDPTLAGVDYILKTDMSGANGYETTKFAGSDQVMVSKSVVRYFSALQRRRADG